jgi:hypothetical protein
MTILNKPFQRVNRQGNISSISIVDIGDAAKIAKERWKRKA